MLKLEEINKFLPGEYHGVKSIVIDDLFRIDNSYEGWDKEFPIKIQLQYSKNTLNNVESLFFDIAWNQSRLNNCTILKEVKDKLKEFNLISEEENNLILNCNFSLKNKCSSFNLAELITTGETSFAYNEYFTSFMSKEKLSLQSRGLVKEGKGLMTDLGNLEIMKNILFDGIEEKSNLIYYEISVHCPTLSTGRISLLKNNLSVEEIVEKVKGIFRIQC